MDNTFQELYDEMLKDYKMSKGVNEIGLIEECIFKKKFCEWMEERGLDCIYECLVEAFEQYDIDKEKSLDEVDKLYQEYKKEL